MKNILIFFGITLMISACFDEPEQPRTAQEQLDIDIEKIDQYLAENNITAEVDSSGIRYVTVLEGTGNAPQLQNRVKVTYEGYTLEDVTFDKNDQGVTFPLNGLIPAWQIMIPTMKEGGKLTIYAPSGYCYGSRGSGSIPANTSLIFEITLLEVL